MGLQAMENLGFRLDNAPNLLCEQKNETVSLCQKCDACILAWKVFCTKEWFRRISERSRQKFVVKILRLLKNLELLKYFENLLDITQRKDYTYFRSRVILDQKDDRKMFHCAVKKVDEKIKDLMPDILRWFGKSSYRMKANYTLLLLQMCDSRLLFIAASVIRILLAKHQRRGGVVLEQESEVSLFRGSLKESISNELNSSSRSAVSLPRSLGNQSLFDIISQDEDLNLSDGTSRASFPVSGETLSKKTGVFVEEEHFPPRLPSCSALKKQLPDIKKCKDFIRCLPIHITKYILGFLDKKALQRCSLVSRHWAMLVEQIKKDNIIHHYAEHKLTLLQGNYIKGISVNYANKIPVPVPKQNEDGKVLPSKGSRWRMKIKGEYNLWTAYQGQEIVTVQMEERNIFCGSYNIRILFDKWDNTRVIHFCGGEFVAMTANRKIELLKVNQTKKVHTSLRGHAGSIRTLILCEKESFVLSGSYDLSIRCWSMISGLCIKIFSGHMGTVTCLDLHEGKLVSGSKDCLVKVWEMNTGKCIKTFKHKNPVLVVKINSTYVVSGCEGGLVKIWHLASSTLVKTLSGHEGPIKCLSFDDWHLVTGSSDGFLIGWSMVGNFERCLIAFKHPREVLCVAFLYLRIISGCADGKIRIYNFLTGACLKVIKANSRGDPVLSFFIEGNRMVINTVSNIMLYQFEEIKWHYHSEKHKQSAKKPKEKDEISSIKEQRASHPKICQENELKQSESLKIQESLIPSQSQTGIRRLSQSSSNEDSRLDFFQEDASSNAVDTFPVHQSLTVEPSETAFQSLKKPSLSLSPDQLLLTINSLQQAHTISKPDRLRVQKASIRDAWGPAVLQQETSNNFPDLKTMALLPGVAEQASQIKKLKSATIAPGLKKTSIPFEIQKLQPNINKSLYSSKICSYIPQPMIIRPKSCGAFKDVEERVQTKPFSFVDGQVQKIGKLTSTHIIKPTRMVIRNFGESSSCWVKPPMYTVTANPFRNNTGFMLLTVKQKKEYNEAKMMEYKNMNGTVIPEKASKVAWLRKIRGLAVDDFTKKGRTAAPEFGHNMFI